jgi:hypothetical protein
MQATQATIPQGQTQQGQVQSQDQGQAIWQLIQNEPQLSQIGQVIQQNPALQQLVLSTFSLSDPP